MPLDNIYAEKRLPSPFRHIWRLFYHDTSAMVGFYGFIALLFLCLFGGWLAPYGLDQQFWATSCCRLHGRVMATSPFPRHRRFRT